MFRNIISSTPYVTGDANDYFERVYGDNFNGDHSMLSTLRALIHPRMAENETLRVLFKSSNFTQSEITSVDKNRALNAMIGTTPDNDGTLIIQNITGEQDGISTSMEIFQEQFCNKYSGYSAVSKITEFYQKSFRVLCFVNPEKRSAVLVVENLDMRRLHYLQCSILAVLPWFLNPEEGVTELEMELIRSLRERSSDTYLACLKELIKQYDFRTVRIKKLLAGFETRNDRERLRSVEAQIENTRERISEYNRQIGSYYNQLNEYHITMLGLQQKIDNASDDDSEIMDYFMRNDRLDLRSVNDSSMVFCVKDYLEFFDEDAAERAIENDNSFVYSYRDRTTKDDLKLLMKAVFIDKTIRIRMCAAYYFALDGNVTAKSFFEFGSEYADYMPNTHINRYSCLGNYERTINEILAHHDYVGAIEQCIASCRSLNWHDGTVMKEFMRTVCGTSEYGFNNKAFELPDGRVVSPKDAIEWLKTEQA